MGVPIVKKCCCCVSLHTGTLLIGCLYCIWALAEFVGYTLLVTLRPLDKDGVSTHKQVLFVAAAAVSGLHLLLSILLVVAAVMGIPLKLRSASRVLENTCHKDVEMPGQQCHHAVIIYWVSKKKACMTLPWTIITGLITAVVFVMGLMAVSLVLQDWSDIKPEVAVFVAVLLIRACLSSYCIVVVHSRHKEIMNERHRLEGIRYQAVRRSKGAL